MVRIFSLPTFDTGYSQRLFLNDVEFFILSVHHTRTFSPKHLTWKSVSLLSAAASFPVLMIVLLLRLVMILTL